MGDDGVTVVPGVSYTVAAKGDAPAATATFNQWALDNTRLTSYPVQNVWGNEVKDLFKSSSRYVERDLCMWASGKFYNNAIGSFKAELYGRYDNENNGWKEMTEASQYVRENTTAPKQMSKATCTRVLVKATYTLTGKTKGDLIGINDKVYKKTDLVDIVKAAIDENGDTYTIAVKDGVTAGEHNFDDVVTISKKTVAQGEDANASAAVYREAAAAAGVLNYAGEEVNYYVNGECFYVAYIKHFGAETEPSGNEVLPIFPNQYQDKHTGRYGILRNNWYELNLKSVKGIGLPTIPDPDPNHTPDDDGKRTERNMDVNINILNWAKRSQNVEF